MPIPFTCPHCGSANSIADVHAGSSAACAACGKTVTVPGNPVSTFSGSNPAPPSKNPNNNSPVVMILVVVAAVCGGGFLIVGVLAAMLIPAIQAAREAANRSACRNNMREIAVAMQNHQDQRGDMVPLNLAVEGGPPLHSWRSLLLPYIERQSMFRQIELTESWNAPRHSSLRETPIETYRCQSAGEATTFPSYYSVEGEFAAMQPVVVAASPLAKHYRSNTSFASMVDGLSATAAAFEVAGSNVNWMQPTDFSFADLGRPINASRDGRSVSSAHPNGVNVVFLDSQVVFLRNDVSPEIVKKMADRRDGEIIHLGQFQ